MTNNTDLESINEFFTDYLTNCLRYISTHTNKYLYICANNKLNFGIHDYNC